MIFCVLSLVMHASVDYMYMSVLEYEHNSLRKMQEGQDNAVRVQHTIECGVHAQERSGHLKVSKIYLDVLIILLH